LTRQSNKETKKEALFDDTTLHYLSSKIKRASKKSFFNQVKEVLNRFYLYCKKNISLIFFKKLPFMI